MSSSVKFGGDNKKVWGPGHWYIIHTLARDASNEEKKNDFCKMMDHISKNLPCKECQGHCQEYLKANPMKPYWQIMEEGKDIGLFKWAWTFHNAVNKRLDKPYLDWNTAKKMYFTDDGICTSTCDEGKDAPKEDKKINQPNVTMIKVTLPNNKLSPSLKYLYKNQ